MSQVSDYETADSSEYTFQCPYCEFKDSHEWLVRVHINRSDDNVHSHHDGFMPEDEVEKVSQDGRVVETRSGNPRRRFETLQNLEPEDMPKGLSQQERTIVLAAVQNLNENYSELTRIANDELRGTGLDTVEYNKTYRTVTDELGLARKSKNMSQQQEKSFEDLTDKQQAVIREAIQNPDANPSSLAEPAGVNQSYPHQVLDKYGHIAEEMTIEDIKEVETDQDEEPTESTGTETDEPDAETKKSYEKLTTLQQNVVDQFVEFPDKTEEEIAEELGCDETYPGKVKSKFSPLIKSMRGDTETGTEESSISIAGTEFTVPEDHKAEFDGLTKKQRDVIIELLKENDPLNPTRTQGEIGDAAGVHGSYVNEVTKKYGDLAEELAEHVDLKDAGIEVESQAKPEEPESTDSDPESEEFESQFRQAVEDGDVSQVTVTEILDNIDSIEDGDLIETALEIDSRKTSSQAFENRLDTIRPDEKTDEVPTMDETMSTEEEADSETTSADESLTSHTEVLQEMRERSQMLIRTAESELEESDQKAPAARAKSVAEEFQRMIDAALED